METFFGFFKIILFIYSAIHLFCKGQEFIAVPRCSLSHYVQLGGETIGNPPYHISHVPAQLVPGSVIPVVCLLSLSNYPPSPGALIKEVPLPRHYPHRDACCCSEVMAREQGTCQTGTMVPPCP